ncbi:MAG: hypothetical protein ACTSP4_16355 [Candidatus Hodarchaeales archaeon]
MKKVIVLIYNSPNDVSRQELAAELGFSPQFVSCICKKLVGTKIFDESSVNRQKLYSMTEKAVSVFEKMILKSNE